MATHTVSQPTANARPRLRERLFGRAPSNDVPERRPAHSTFPDPDAPTQVIPAVPGARPVKAEVIEHFSPAQLSTTPDWAKVIRIATAAIEGAVSDERALKDLGERIPDIRTKAMRRRRQGRNLAGAGALADSLRAPAANGAAPQPDTDAGDLTALWGAKTMVARSLLAAGDDPEATGLMPSARFDALLEPAAASASGRVAAEGVVHRQHPGRATALPACSDATPGGLAFVPSWREVDCADCLRASGMVGAEPVAAPSPVHSDAAPPLPEPEDPSEGNPDVGSPLSRAVPLPHRVPNPLAPVESIPARLDADGQPEAVSPCEAQDVKAGEWLLDDGAWHLVRTAGTDGETVTLRLGDIPNPFELHFTAEVYAIGALFAQSLLADATRVGADTTEATA